MHRGKWEYLQLVSTETYIGKRVSDLLKWNILNDNYVSGVDIHVFETDE
jgi:hypothetical protein